MKVIKITYGEYELIQIRAKIFGMVWKGEPQEFEFLKLNTCTAKFAVNGDIVQVLIEEKGKNFIESIKEINELKNNNMESLMANKTEPTGTELFGQLQDAVAGAEENGKKAFEKGNKTAGVRFRKDLKSIVELCKALKVQSLKV